MCRKYLRMRTLVFHKIYAHKWLCTAVCGHNIFLVTISWCAQQESNLHSSRNWNLNPTRLPVPPRAHIKFSAFFNLLGSSRENFTVVTLPKSIAYANFATGAYYFSPFNIKSPISIIILLYRLFVNLSSKNLHCNNTA